ASALMSSHARALTICVCSRGVATSLLDPVRFTASSIGQMGDPLGELRNVVLGHAPAAAQLSNYLAKVRDRAFAVTDQDVEALKEAGISEDEIFEQTVSVAIAEGLRRLDRAAEVIE